MDAFLVQSLEKEPADVPVFDIHTHLVGGRLGARIILADSCGWREPVTRGNLQVLHDRIRKRAGGPRADRGRYRAAFSRS